MQCKVHLRVAMLGSYPASQAQLRGGVQAAYAYLTQGLARIEGLELHILTLRHPGWNSPDRIEQDGITIHLLPPFPRFERLRNYRNYQASLAKRMEEIQPHVIHAQEAAADAYVALRSGYPTIITVHGIRNEDLKHCRSWGQRLRFYFDGALTERYVIGRARYVIAISRYMTDYFASLFRPDVCCYSIPNAVDERFFGLNGDISRPMVLFAGRVTPLKRVLDLVHAFERVVRQIPSAQLHIAGECRTDAAYVRSIQETIRRAGLEKNIHLLGELDQGKILQEFAACSVIALPSAQENAPMVISQAMAAGKPTVATRVGGVAEMVGENDERGVLIDVGDVNRLAEAIVNLLQDRGRCEQMGNLGRRFALQNYHPLVVAQRTAELYREIEAREGASHG